MTQRASFGAEGHDGRESLGTLVAVVAGLALLLGVVAFASRGHQTPLGHGGSARGPSEFLADVVVTLLLCAMVVTALFVVYIHTWKRARAEPSRADWKRTVLPLAYLGLLLLVIVSVQRGTSGGGKHRARPVPQITAPTVEPGPKHLRSRAPHIEWFLVAGIAALGAAAVIVPAVRRRLAVSRYEREQRLAETLAVAVDDSLDALYAEPDARRAVIAAYARMERTLEAEGLGRGSAEAPIEYLRRVLHELRANTRAAFALTELYGRAKFSPHPVDADMKAEAIAALVALRNDLRAAAA
jgi:hypothetical protein